MSFCENCNRSFNNDLSFCPTCGQPVCKMVNCSNCNTEIKQSELYCHKCGHKNMKYHVVYNINQSQSDSQRKNVKLENGNVSWVEWIRKNKVIVIMSAVMLVMAIVLISVVADINPTPKSIGQVVVKESKQDTPGTDFRIKKIEYYTDDWAKIEYECKNSYGNWIDDGYTMVVKCQGKWQIE
ncbi:MAG: zinc ribbon domain-containing protein [Ruminiclostridium sp.]